MLLERTVLLKVAWRDPGSPSLLAEARRCAGVGSDAGRAVYSVGHHRGVEFVAGERCRARRCASTWAATPAAGARLAPTSWWRCSRVSRGRSSGSTAPASRSATSTPRRSRWSARGGWCSGGSRSGRSRRWGRPGCASRPRWCSAASRRPIRRQRSAIDLYGLGCLGLELALGRAPFAGRLDAGAVDRPRAHARAAGHRGPHRPAGRARRPAGRAGRQGSRGATAQRQRRRRPARDHRRAGRRQPRAACACWWSTTTAIACARSGARCAAPTRAPRSTPPATAARPRASSPAITPTSC
jgi:hypothetical protein